MGTDRVETIDGSAVEGEDYQPVNEILTFEPHEREKEIGYAWKEISSLYLWEDRNFHILKPLQLAICWKKKKSNISSSFLYLGGNFANVQIFRTFIIFSLFLRLTRVTIVDDNQWEPDEEFFLKLTLLPGRDSDNVKLGRTSIMEITILNDDGEFGTWKNISRNRFQFKCV